MLFDQIINTSKNVSERLGDCSKCTHPSGKCSGSCLTCLDEVHWWPKYEGRSDYNCKKLRLYYVQKFAERYANNISTITKKIDLSQYPRFDIISLGCGTAPDLMAFEDLSYGREIFYKGYDRNKLWAAYHSEVERYAKGTNNITVKFLQRDVFDVFAEGKPRHHNYNIVVIQYLISHLYNTQQNNRINDLYTGIINNIVKRRLKGVPFLIIINDIDTYHKGRNLFYRFIEELEDAGYYGRAVAISAHENGDLGKTRWGINENRRGNISYQYESPPIDYEGASLLIELRC